MSAQKTTSKKTTSGKSSSRKTTSKKRAAAKKSSVKKGKVTVSPIGLIVLCGGVILCCLVLLLATTIAERRPEIVRPPVDIEKPSEKAEPVKTSESKKNETAKNDAVKNHADSAKPATAKKNAKSETSSGAEIKKTAPKNTEEKKPVQPKTEQTKPVEQKKEPVKPVEKKTTEETVKITTPAKKETASVSKGFDFPNAVNGAQLCILLDDGGQNLEDLKKFLALKIPVTVAVLPKLRDSVTSANAVRASGYGELMLHQPMQAVNLNVNPGPGAIKPDMNDSEIRALVQENLREIGPVSGMNNHEGSLITADAMKMETVIDVAHLQGIYFLDSRTNVETKIPYVSRELGYGWYERNGYFLDNQKTRDEFLKELRKNLDIANKTGCVIMIAHVWSADYMPALIREVYPELVAKGYSFTTVGKSRGLKN